MPRAVNISYHTYAMLRDCRFRYKLAKVDRVPERAPEDCRNQIYGFVTQRLFERFYVDEWFKAGAGAAQKLYDELPGVLREQLAKHPCIWEHRSEIEILERDAQVAIPLFIKAVKEYGLLGEKNTAEVLLEYDISRQFRLTGRADFILYRKKDVYLLDGKGTKYGDQYLDEEQLLFYLLIMRQLHMRKPTKIGFWLWREAVVKWIDMSDTRVEDLYTKVKELLFKLQQGDFLATPSSKGCKFCPYRDMDCPTYAVWHKHNQDVRNVNKPKLVLPEPGADGLLTGI